MSEDNCTASVVSAISDAATVVVRSLKSVLKLFFLKKEINWSACSHC